MTIYVVKGDLLESDCDAIAHQSNCFKTFGSGIAEQIKFKFPEAFEADKNYKKEGADRLGHTSFALARNGKIVFNLYGQYAYGRDKQHTQVDKLRRAIREMIFILRKVAEKKECNIRDFKIGLPYKIGSDRGGASWDEVYTMIEEVSELEGVDIYLYEYTPKKKKR